MTSEETRAYMRKYYLAHKEQMHQKYLDWCAANQGRNKSERGKENKTPEEIKQYQQDYYAAHKDRFIETHTNWVKANPKRYVDGQRSWRKKNSHYPRDYARARKEIVEPLIFQFLDNGFDGDVEGFSNYLRTQIFSEQHIRWFEKDVQQFMGVDE